MIRTLVQRGVVALLAGTLATSAVHAQRGQPVDVSRMYNAPRDYEHMLECTATPLTKDLQLDAEQWTALRQAIRVYKDTTTRVRSQAEANRRQAVRDSTIRSLLRTQADSATFRRNLGRERSWWTSGGCNGLPVPRTTRPS